MLAQIEVFSLEEARELLEYLDSIGYRWNNGSDLPNIFSNDWWQGFGEHQFFLTDDINKPGTLLRSQAKTGRYYKFDGTFQEYKSKFIVSSNFNIDVSEYL